MYCGAGDVRRAVIAGSLQCDVRGALGRSHAGEAERALWGAGSLSSPAESCILLTRAIEHGVHRHAGCFDVVAFYSTNPTVVEPCFANARTQEPVQESVKTFRRVGTALLPPIKEKERVSAFRREGGGSRSSPAVRDKRSPVADAHFLTEETSTSQPLPPAILHIIQRPDHIGPPACVRFRQLICWRSPCSGGGAWPISRRATRGRV
ncbi:hypothetical protein SKAU_G00395800 [Synaphobranchus kaupii]|uniref:Uncharacterized protein n=1 Tax=Synaphobranchus kaupii TaxID=118154 RepID=A0A9Q1ECG3_SYNKA|nr:hypothetical protein SKAU_G00395800 [Synaphobranchus kaupii]